MPDSPRFPADDPLGPSFTTAVGRPISGWKRHWMTHGTQWLIAGGVLLAGVVIAVVSWAIRESADFYAAGPSRPTVIEPAVVSPPAVSRLVAGPISLDIQMGKLEEGERVIVIRDVVKILQDRLQLRGFEVLARAPNKLVIYYREDLGPPIDVFQETSDGKQKWVNTMRPVGVSVKLVLERPREPNWVLGESTRSSSGRPVRLGIHESGTRLNSARRKLYQQSYRASLAYLGQIELPSPASASAN